MNFEELGLGPEVLKAINDCGYTTPTPIQEAAIPIILMARDIVGLAQTGTGKTAAFTLPMIEILFGGRARARMPRSLILSPTRELAAQIAENFDLYGKYHPLSKALLVGGESMSDQQKILERGVDVLIATPGRLLDLFDRGNILLSDIKMLVIDEADRMLDMGFIPDIEKIISKIPPIRQTLLFSATMPPEIKKLSDKFLSNPKTVKVEAPAKAPIEDFLVWTSFKQKRQVLRQLLQQEDVKNAFVFCNRKRETGELAKWLKEKGFNAAPMNGDMVQSVRTQTLKDFKDDKIRLLVCSDVAARGLDVDAVSHVFNYDVPFSPEDYVHRIGRTGRAGMKGRAWSIATEDDMKFVKGIEKLIGRPIQVHTIDASVKPEASEGEDRPARGREGRGEGRGESRGEGRRDRGPRNDRPRREHQDAAPAREARPERQEQDRPQQDRPQQDRPAQDRNQNAPRRDDNKSQRPRRDQNDDGPNKFDGDDVPAFLRR